MAPKAPPLNKPPKASEGGADSKRVGKSAAKSASGSPSNRTAAAKKKKPNKAGPAIPEEEDGAAAAVEVDGVAPGAADEQQEVAAAPKGKARRGRKLRRSLGDGTENDAVHNLEAVAALDETFGLAPFAGEATAAAATAADQTEDGAAEPATVEVAVGAETAVDTSALEPVVAASAATAADLQAATLATVVADSIVTDALAATLAATVAEAIVTDALAAVSLTIASPTGDVIVGMAPVAATPVDLS
tara:strand:- start:2770 stop:3507 length:738 start_codon:yes stop_codon:yes gene_type:complete